MRHGLVIALEENVAALVFSILVRDFGMSEEALVLYREHAWLCQELRRS